MTTKSIIKKGTMFGYWSYLRETNKAKGKRKIFCVCTGCNKTKKDIGYSDAKNGKSLSCGCKKGYLRIGKTTTHGLSKHPLYTVYQNMKARCYNKNSDRYKNYGNRGIKICKEWLRDFSNFSKWAFQNGYEKGLQIDRENNDGNYEPKNCRWVTRKINMNNTSRNTKIVYEGKFYDSFTVFWEQHNKDVPYAVAYHRYANLGWNIYKAVVKKPKKKNIKIVEHNGIVYKNLKELFDVYGKNIKYDTARKRFYKMGMSAFNAVTKNDTRVESNKAKATHNLSTSPLFSYWRRVVNSNCFCKEWSNIKIFIKWAEESGFEKGLTLYRQNDYIEYSPKNCYFGVTKNVKQTIIYKEERYTSFRAFWKKFNNNVKYDTALYRFQNGISAFEAVSKKNCNIVKKSRKFIKRKRFYFSPDLVRKRRNEKDLA